MIYASAHLSFLSFDLPLVVFSSAPFGFLHSNVIKPQPPSEMPQNMSSIKVSSNWPSPASDHKFIAVSMLHQNRKDNKGRVTLRQAMNNLSEFCEREMDPGRVQVPCLFHFINGRSQSE